MNTEITHVLLEPEGSVLAFLSSGEVYRCHYGNWIFHSRVPGVSQNWEAPGVAAARELADAIRSLRSAL